jgi:hypothetical protein
VNRWRQRLDELHGETRACSAAISHAVQNVQKPKREPRIEHFEQIEHRADSAAAASGAVTSANWSEAEKERAAIVEYNGGIPRAWAEGFARLHPDRPPGDVATKRWQQFIDDIGQFLDAGWGEKVAGLGWGPLDLFGCDRERPFARVDHAGLLGLLNGDKLIELDRHNAVIERRTGSRQTFRRRPVAVGDVVLAWELVL